MRSPLLLPFLGLCLVPILTGCPSKDKDKDNNATSTTSTASTTASASADAAATKSAATAAAATPQTASASSATPSKPPLLAEAKFLNEWRLKRMPVVRPSSPSSVRTVNSMADAPMVPSLVAVDGLHSRALLGIEPPTFSHGAREIVMLDWSTHESTSTLMQNLGEPTPDAGAFDSKTPDAVSELAAFQKALVFAGPAASSSFLGTISPDAKTIVFRAGFNLYRANADGSNIEHFGKAVDGSWPTYSPKGDVVAYIGCAGEVVTREAHEAEPPPGLIPHDPHGHKEGPPATAVCPNTTSFTLHLADALKPGDSDRSLYAMTAPSPPQFSADGAFVYIASAEKDKNPCVYAVPVSAGGGEPKKFACAATTPVVPDVVATTAISPSKKVFALIMPAQVKGGGFDVILIDLPSGAVRAKARTSAVDLRRNQFVLTDDGALVGASLHGPPGATGSGITVLVPQGTADALAPGKEKTLHWDDAQAHVKAVKLADKTHIAFLVERQDIAELDLMEIPHL